jgi:hypothetical protein
MRQQIPSLNKQNNSHTIDVIVLLPLLVKPTQKLLRHKQMVTTPTDNFSKATGGMYLYFQPPNLLPSRVFSNDLSAAMLHGTE